MPFEKGKSGNPSGKKKGEKWLADAIRIAVRETHDENRDKLRALADKIVEKALEGDVSAFKEIADRLDGKPQQSVDVDVDARGDFAEFLAMIAQRGKRLTDDSSGD